MVGCTRGGRWFEAGTPTLEREAGRRTLSDPDQHVLPREVVERRPGEVEVATVERDVEMLVHLSGAGRPLPPVRVSLPGLPRNSAIFSLLDRYPCAGCTGSGLGMRTRNGAFLSGKLCSNRELRPAGLVLPDDRGGS